MRAHMNTKNHSPEDTAELLIQMFKNRGLKVIRINRQTMRNLSGRIKIRGQFLNWLRDCLKRQGFTLTVASEGKFGLHRKSLIDGAPITKSKDYLPRADRKRILASRQSA